MLDLLLLPHPNSYVLVREPWFVSAVNPDLCQRQALYCYEERSAVGLCDRLTQKHTQRSSSPPIP